MLKQIFRSETEKGDIKVYKYRPMPHRLFYEILDEQDRKLKRKLRFLGQWFRGSLVYYLEVQNELVAYCVVTRGGGCRCSFSTSDDILLSPYYVKKEQRGNRFSELLISTVLTDKELSYEKVYDWIRKDNVPSLKCSLSCGMKVVATADLHNRFLRSFRLFDFKSDGSGEWCLLCADRTELLDKQRII